MYFLDDRSLRADLARDRQPQFDVAVYLFLGTTLAVPVFYPAPVESVSDVLPSWRGFLDLVLAFGISLWGIRRCFLANGGAEGVAFAERFVSISWVVGWQIALPVIPVFLIATFLVPPALLKHVNVVWLLLAAFYYFRMSDLIARTRAEAEARRITSP